MFRSMDGANKQQSARWTRNLFLAVATLLFAELTILVVFPMPLLDPDEPLFACVAREMIRTGDYVTPVFKGEPFHDRPALFYWILVASVFALGDGDLAYRIPSFLLGVGTILFTSWLAMDLFRWRNDSKGNLLGLDPGLIGASSAFALTTSIGGAVLLFAIGHDAALVFFVTAAIWTGFRWQCASGEDSPRKWVYAAGTGVFLGLACLSKGLLGFLLPALAILSFHFVLGRRIQIRGLLVAVPLAVGIGGSWYVLMHLRHPDYVRYYLWERHVLGFLTNSQRHGENPIWVYLPTALIVGCPWILLLPIRHGWRIPPRPWDRRVVATLTWFCMTFFFFAIAGSRNPTYLLPASVPLAILFGVRIAEVLHATLGRSERIENAPEWMAPMNLALSRIPMLTFAGFLIALPIALFRFHRPHEVVVAAGVVSAILLLLTIRAARRYGFSSLGSLYFQVGITMLLFASTTAIVLPEIARERSARDVVAYLRERHPDGPICWFNHIPPSALYHGSGLTFQRVYFDDLQSATTTPFVLVTRESRIQEVAQSKFAALAEHVDLGGKYHVFFRAPNANRLATSTR